MSRTFSRELTIRTDFNSVDDERRFIASLRFAESAARPTEGESVFLYDQEGNSVRGVVDRIEGMIVHVRPEMATWSSTAITIEISPKPTREAPSWTTDAEPTEGVIPAHASGVQVA